MLNNKQILLAVLEPNIQLILRQKEKEYVFFEVIESFVMSIFTFFVIIMSKLMLPLRFSLTHVDHILEGNSISMTNNDKVIIVNIGRNRIYAAV